MKTGWYSIEFPQESQVRRHIVPPRLLKKRLEYLEKTYAAKPSKIERIAVATLDAGGMCPVVREYVTVKLARGRSARFATFQAEYLGWLFRSLKLSDVGKRTAYRANLFPGWMVYFEPRDIARILKALDDVSPAAAIKHEQAVENLIDANVLAPRPRPQPPK